MHGQRGLENGVRVKEIEMYGVLTSGVNGVGSRLRWWLFTVVVEYGGKQREDCRSTLNS
ncbi:hypothetical protein JG687_00013057 [Phytophthora cactorum]|uniref:Uncharacterized protein n=1 Tax=Phytophthora cactorum TaxID=29920 RepID=A0A8T1U289_9STRA|nr:hypothetical protein JG687_00013057 [Phytophthora cactorum]